MKWGCLAIKYLKIIDIGGPYPPASLPPPIPKGEIKAMTRRLIFRIF
jgi:hypothetical protein